MLFLALRRGLQTLLCTLAGVAESLDGVITEAPSARVRFGNPGPERAGTTVVKPWPNDVTQLTQRKVRPPLGQGAIVHHGASGTSSSTIDKRH